MEIPLASPAIMAGIRIAAVTTISLATVAAYIGAGGLGAPIFDAIQSGFKTEFVAAGALAIILAILVDLAARRGSSARSRRGAGAECRPAEMSTSDPFTFFVDNLSLFGSKTTGAPRAHVAAVGVAIAIAIPLGVWLGHIHRGSFFAISVSNIGRALPSLAVISIGIGILGIGFLNVARGAGDPGRPGDPDQCLRRRSTGSIPTWCRPRGRWG